jgi:hypothetical protein
VIGQKAFQTIWQQDQSQSHFSPAALIGLGRVALRMGDQLASRDHFAAALGLTVALQTAPQALEAPAGVAHVQAQTGQLEEALDFVALVLHHPASFQETKERVAELEAELSAALLPEQAQAALARGEACELWDVVADVIVSLQASITIP